MSPESIVTGSAPAPAAGGAPSDSTGSTGSTRYAGSTARTRPMPPNDAPPARGPRWRLGLLAALALAAAAVFLTIDVTGAWGFVLRRRGMTLATLAVVAVSVALATVVFQTVTTNGILTPSIMGFDSLYVLVQTVAVVAFGTSALTRLGDVPGFLLETALMVGFALLLYRWLLVDLRRSLHLLVLTGIVIGGLFRSVSSFLQRVMDPTAFVVLQDRFFARFDAADPALLTVTAVITAVVGAWLWHIRPTLDVLTLGRERATSLGVPYRRTVIGLLAVVALLVATATALVGPTSFFGLLVAHLAYTVMGTHRHAVTLPAAALAGIVCLVGGQVLLERVLGFDGSLSIVVEFLGGIVFIALLVRRNRA